MAHRCVSKFRLANSRFLDAQHFHSSSASLDALAVPLAEYSTSASSSVTNPLDDLRQQKIADLRSLLALNTPSPNRVWGSYLELTQYYDTANLPLDVHQAVLRKCAPPPVHVRALAARRLAEGGKYKEDQLYESRYQKIIRNIRSAGDTPTLEDYHCVMELFAAVGNHEGAMLVLEEIGRVGLVKVPKTYRLCLQTLCHRLTLPVWHLDRPALVQEISARCYAIIKEMATRGIPYDAQNVDLAYRILKESMHMEAFTALLRHAYGIDLAYPDRSPLEYWKKTDTSLTNSEVKDAQTALVPAQLPFTLAAFNTTIDYLGRTGNVSKLIQTFEVMTTPLPPSASNTTFEDDDDEDFGFSNPQVAPYRAPHIHPNTTSFYYLLKWIGEAHHGTLLRHYILVALEQERKQKDQLRQWAMTKSPQELISPCLSVNRNLFLPVFSYANRYKNMGLLRWVIPHIRAAMHRRQDDIGLFEAVRAKWIQEGVYERKRPVDSDLEDGLDENLPSAAPTSHFSAFFTPSSSARQMQPEDISASSSLLPAEIDLPPPKPSPTERHKVFDIDRHLDILRRELEELEQFETQAGDIIGRTSQRIKERLGRRVWDAKDVYFRDANRRVVVSKDVWRSRVNFLGPSEVQTKRAEAVKKMGWKGGRLSKETLFFRDAWLGAQYRRRPEEPQMRDSPPHLRKSEEKS